MLKIEQQKSLKPYNTFGLSATAAFFTEVNSIEELILLYQDEKFRDVAKLFLGGGSNVLLTKDYQGLVIHNCLKGIEVVSRDADFVLVKAASGEVWHEFVLYCIDSGFGGVENMSLIPGSVGAGPMQNIGAYGVEMKDVFFELEALNLATLKIEKFTNADCKFGYRESVFKNEKRNQYFIVAVTFRLSLHPTVNTTYGAIQQQLQAMNVESPTIKDVSDAVIAIRSAKLPNPSLLGNSGSFFKNPEISISEYERLKMLFPNVVAYPTNNGYKLAAGWLIEQCGWKGKVVGNCGAHKDQALVLVNYGHASGNEIYQLALAIQQSVFEKFQVKIIPEVNII
ncbi:MAG: UDP-N-acetylmuramate dehydrogenase [Bacteroidota bacterium]